MQEPILFNWSIKENIKYGKLDATDEEVYKAALAANALEFIEGETGENTTKKDMPVKLTEDLETHLLKFFISSNLQTVQVKSLLGKWTEKQQRLVLDVLRFSNKPVQELLTSDWSKFLLLIETEGEAPGIKWGETVVRFEW